MRQLSLILCLLSAAGSASAQSAPPAPAESIPAPTGKAHAPRAKPVGPKERIANEGFRGEQHCADCYDGTCWEHGQDDWLSESMVRFHDFTSRNSQTHGRSTGLGKPLRGTSWLNRPYEASVDFGAFLMTSRPQSGVRAANDKFAALTIGWDWDHYWGSQARLGWASPDLNTNSATLQDSDNLFLLDASMLYYPWGDSRIRPYGRLGMGLTDIEYANVNGAQQQEFLFTIPFGVGVKHQFRRWLVGRMEVVNNLAFGMNETNTMNNLTITAGIEARFGGRPGGYWAWRPRGYGW